MVPLETATPRAAPPARERSRAAVDAVVVPIRGAAPDAARGAVGPPDARRTETGGGRLATAVRRRRARPAPTVGVAGGGGSSGVAGAATAIAGPCGRGTASSYPSLRPSMRPASDSCSVRSRSQSAASPSDRRTG